MHIAVVGNCQSAQLVTGLKYALDSRIEISLARGADAFNGENRQQLSDSLSTADAIITNLAIKRFDGVADLQRIVRIPDLQFGGYHPDQTYLALSSSPNAALTFYGDTPVSALGFWAFMRNLTIPETTKLFTAEIFEKLGYFNYFHECVSALHYRFQQCCLPFDTAEEALLGREVLMWFSWHPKMSFTLALVKSLLNTLGIEPAIDPMRLRGLIPDPLESEAAWGCYPPLADYLGVPGSWAIRHRQIFCPSLAKYLEALFEWLAQFKKEELTFFLSEKKIFSLSQFDNVLSDSICHA